MEPSPTQRAEGAAGRPRIDWSAALAEHGRWLRTVLMARLRDAHAVDEVFQEVSMAAVSERAPLSDASKLAPWLYRLAVTQALLYRRKLGRRRKLIDRVANRLQPTEASGVEHDPLGWLLADEQRAMIRRALATLPQRDAEILLLKYTEHWSYHQLAEHLGISHSAIEARLHRARARLREQLASHGVIESSLASSR